MFKPLGTDWNLHQSQNKGQTEGNQRNRGRLLQRLHHALDLCNLFTHTGSSGSRRTGSWRPATGDGTAISGSTGPCQFLRPLMIHRSVSTCDRPMDHIPCFRCRAVDPESQLSSKDEYHLHIQRSRTFFDMTFIMLHVNL